jgi:hypothetical protein
MNTRRLSDMQFRAGARLAGEADVSGLAKVQWILPVAACRGEVCGRRFGWRTRADYGVAALL